jgi:hypothetical protein
MTRLPAALAQRLGCVQRGNRSRRVAGFRARR